MKFLTKILRLKFSTRILILSMLMSYAAGVAFSYVLPNEVNDMYFIWLILLFCAFVLYILFVQEKMNEVMVKQ